MSFELRRRYWGRLKLRPGLPPASRSAPELSFYELLLSRAPAGPSPLSVAEVWDVGCRNWSYAAALAGFFPRARLTGVEVDAGRRYWNLHRRGDAALAQVAALRDSGRAVRFLAGDFGEIAKLAGGAGAGSEFAARSGLSDEAGIADRLENDAAVARDSDRGVEASPGSVVVCFFFPFVSENPCRRWGLPARYANFPTLLKAASALAPAGWTLSAHQGEWEAELARGAYAAAGARSRESVVAAAEFAGLWPSPHDVHLLAAQLG